MLELRAALAVACSGRCSFPECRRGVILTRTVLDGAVPLSAETMQCTATEGGAISFVFPNGSETIISREIHLRSQLLAKLLDSTAFGERCEVPAREGASWVACSKMTSAELQDADDEKLIEYLKVRTYRDVFEPFRQVTAILSVFRLRNLSLFESSTCTAALLLQHSIIRIEDHCCCA